MTNNHLFINYTPQERLSLYEYALEKSKQLGYKSNFDKSNLDLIEKEVKNGKIIFYFR